MSKAVLFCYTLLMLISGANLLLLVYSFTRKNWAAGIYFRWLMAAMTLYSFSYGGELAAGNLDDMVIWVYLEHLGIAFIPTAWLLFCARFANRATMLTSVVKKLMWAMSMGMIMAFVSSPWYGLYYREGIVLNPDSPFPSAAFGALGPWFWVHLAYLYITLFIGTAIVLQAYVKGERDRRGYLGGILVGSLIPWLLHILYMLGWSPWGIEMSAFGFSISGLVFSWVLFKESYQTEIDLRIAKEAAEASNEAKNKLLAVVSHELRTPLHGIVGMADLLLSTDLNCQQLEYAGTLKHSANLLQSLIDGILHFAKLEAGKEKVIESVFSVREVLDTLHLAFRSQFLAKNVRLIWDYGSLPDEIQTDSMKVQQIVNNLVGNALKFTETGTVSLYADVTREDQVQTKLILLVQDTGIGITAEKLNLIFEEFQQGDHSMTRRHGGVGLGLAVVKRLVSLMGGSVRVDSVLGKGSSFYVELPIQIPEGQAKFTESAQDVFSDKTVLLVDDVAVNRLVLAGNLRRFRGIKLVEAATGAEALERFECNPIDLAFIDINLPDIDGFEVIRRLRAAGERGRRLVIVPVTARSLEQDKPIYNQLDIHTVLAKPFRTQDITEAVSQYLGCSKAGEPLTGQTAVTTTVFDKNRFIDLLQGDKELAEQILAAFYRDFARLYAELKVSIQSQDKAAALAQLHALKGICSNVQAQELYTMIEVLEREWREQCKASQTGLDMAQMGAALARFQAAASQG